MVRAKAIGWVRDSKGRVLRYTYKDVCNCVTTFVGGGKFVNKETGMCNTTPYVAIYRETD